MFDPERRFVVRFRMIESFSYGGDEARVNTIKCVDMLIEGRGVELNWFFVVQITRDLSIWRGVE